MRIKKLKKIRKSLVNIANTYRGVDMNAYTSLAKAVLLLDQAIVSDHLVAIRERPEPRPVRELLFGTA